MADSASPKDAVDHVTSTSEQTLKGVETDEIMAEKDGDRSCCDPRQPGFFKIEKPLLKYKGFFFFFYGAIGSVCSYFSIYYKQLGLSPTQIGVISGMRPFIGFWSGPMLGLLADRFRIKRVILLISAMAWLAFITSIGFIPPAKVDPDCAYVSEVKNNLTQGASEGSDIAPEDRLQESRGWMFDPGDLNRVFITVIILVVLGEVFQSPAGALADSGCVEELGTTDIHKYGHQRAWGSLSPGVSSLVVGAIISSTRTTVKHCGVEIPSSDYRIGYYFFATLMTCCVITCFFFKFQKQTDDKAEGKPKPNPLKVFRMFLTIHYGSWLFSMFVTGICNGVIWGFLFWHIENIGGTQFVIGMANSVSCVSETIMFFLVFRIIEKTGYLTFIAIGYFGYSVRFIIFAVMENPWIVLPFEILQGFTFAGVWAVYIKYLCESVPKEFMGTLQGFLHGVYWGLGSGTGGMLGGSLVETWGARITFWIFAIASFINMLIFLILQKVTKKPNIFGSYEKIAD